MGSRGQFARRQSPAAHVRLGSIANISWSPTDVRFTPEGGHQITVRLCPLWVKSGHSINSASALPRKADIVERGRHVRPAQHAPSEQIPACLQPFLDPSHAGFSRSGPARPFAGTSSRCHCPHKQRYAHRQGPSMRETARCWAASLACRQLRSF